MYFDHYDSPQELAEAINDLMKAVTGRRIHFGPGKPKSGHVALVDRNTDETLRQAYSEARSVAKRLCKQDKSMTPPPHDVEILPLNGLVSIGAWGRSITAQERDGLLKAVKNATSYRSQAKDGQDQTGIPVYRALDLAKRTVTIGITTYPITSEKVWNFSKDLCSALKNDRLISRFEGAQDNKNNVDQLRRQIGRDNLHKLIILGNGVYKLNPETKILNSGQVGIRKTKLEREPKKN